MPNHVYCHILPSTDAGVKLLKEMVEGERGLAGYLIPMPKELINTTSPPRIVTQEEYDKHQKSKEDRHWSRYLTKEMSDDLKDKYQFDNWYDWSIFHHGTKWGCYDNDMDGDTYRFTTAWSPLCNDIIELLAKKIPDFEYYWEEEQGWGGNMEYKDGVCIRTFEYDQPQWSEEICFYIDELGVIKKESDLNKISWDKTELGKGHKFNMVEESGKRWASYCEIAFLEVAHDDGDNVSETGWYYSYNLSDFLGKTIRESLQTIESHSQSPNDDIVEVRQERNPIIWG